MKSSLNGLCREHSCPGLVLRLLSFTARYEMTAVARGVGGLPLPCTLHVSRYHQMAKIRIGVVTLGVVRTESLKERA